MPCIEYLAMDGFFIFTQYSWQESCKKIDKLDKDCIVLHGKTLNMVPEAQLAQGIVSIYNWSYLSSYKTCKFSSSWFRIEPTATGRADVLSCSGGVLDSVVGSQQRHGSSLGRYNFQMISVWNKPNLPHSVEKNIQVKDSIGSNFCFCLRGIVGKKRVPMIQDPGPFSVKIRKFEIKLGNFR